MRALPPTLLLMLAACASTEAPTEAEHRAALLARIDQFNDAIREGDKERYADVFVDDFVFTWSRDGNVYDRAMILPSVVPTPEHTPRVDEVVVRRYGDSAIVSFRVRREPDEPGARVTFSYARIDGVWKVLASHSTRIVEAPEPDSGSE